MGEFFLLCINLVGAFQLSTHLLEFELEIKEQTKTDAHDLMEEVEEGELSELDNQEVAVNQKRKPRKRQSHVHTSKIDENRGWKGTSLIVGFLRFR